jgi:hypothetical protein
VTERTYARVYHEIVDDPRFERIYGNDAALGTWLRMLLVADAVYPQSAPMPRRNSSVTLLLRVGLIEERPNNRYAVHGLQAERERRAASSRIGAVKRWDNERNAKAMPSKAEQSREEQSSGANAPKSQSFIRMGVRADPADIQRQDEDAWTPCSKCDVIGRRHPASGDHPFSPKLRAV